MRWFLAALVAVFATLCFTALPSYAADSQTEPAHSKTLKDNGDGTSTLSLSVTGNSTLSTTSSKADVIIILDRSGSMSYRTGGSTRLAVAKSAVNSLAETLLANNTTSDPDKIRLSLVTFSNYAATDVSSTASLSTFQNAVGNVRANGGTNWEDALSAANSIQARDGAKKYVIFVSDGDPTYRNTQGTQWFWQDPSDYQGHYSGGHMFYGTGNSDPYSNNYNYALQAAQTITGGGAELYSVAAFGNVTDMQSFSESATGRTDRYFAASDQEALNNAFSTIVQSITNSFGYKNVKITDGLTSATSSTVLQSGSSASDFTYTITDSDGNATAVVLDSDGNIKTINGKTSNVTLTDDTGASYTLAVGNPFPAASVSGSTVTWDISALGQLLDGFTYKVSFKVWPSQEAYDTVAALLNGTLSWDDVDQTQYTRTENSDGSYSYGLKTNTEAKVDYTAVKTVDDGQGGISTEETAGSADYDQPDPIKLISDSMSVSKKWVGDATLADNAFVTLELYIDGQPSGKTVTLNADNNWKASVHIAPGLEADGQTLNAGHDYTLNEQATTDSRFEYSSETAHPMIVNGTLAVSDDDGDSTLTATNTLKSSLDITKTVKDMSADSSADAGTLFTYTITVNDAAGGDVWFSIGKGGKTQVFSADEAATRVSGAEAEQDSDGNYTGYFHSASGTQVTVKVKDGENIYFPTLTTGSTYTVTEETPAVGYENTSIANNGGNATNTVPTATGTVDKNNSAYTVAYTNTFNSVSLTGGNSLKVTKSVTGHNATEQFAFTLTPDSATQAAIDDGSIKAADGADQASTTTKGYITKDGSETVSFGKYTFYKEGTYHFTADETTETSAAGWTYDSSTHDITVTVTKNSDGTLTASTGGNNPTFTNSYTAAPVSAKIPVTKNLEVSDGLTPPDIAGKYTFTLKAVTDGAPMPEATSLANPDKDGGTVEFGDIQYTEPGTYEYTVTESGSVDGVTNDSVPERTVQVVVTDDGSGQLTATVNGGSAVAYTNTYTVGEAKATIDVQKTLKSADGLMPPDITGKYTFTLKAVTDGVPMPETTKVTNPGSAGGTATFGEITYTKPGTYKYTVTESGSVDGVTNDSDATKDVTVVVKDNSDGTMSATVNGGKQIAFENTYSASPVTASISAKKVLSVESGDNAPDITGKYTFKLAAVDGAPLPETTSLTNPDKDGGTVDFGKITYTKPGTYRYTLTESGSVAGVTNDANTTRTVEVVVSDDHAGKLKVDSVTSVKDLTFRNVYSVTPVSVDGSALVKKTVTKTDETGNGKTFTFTINGVSSNTNKYADTGSVAFDAGETGTKDVVFDGLTFTEPGTYRYTVTEDNPGSGWTVKNNPAEVTIDVTDNGKGALNAKVSGATISNSYKASTTVDTDAEGSAFLTKTVSAASATKGATFEFELVGTSDNTKDADGNFYSADGVATFAAGETGSKAVDFGNIAYTQAGTYTYKITETSVPSGWTASPTEAEVTVTVTDNGDGTLAAQVTGATIENSYSVQSVTAKIPVTKKLSVPEGLTGPGDITGKYTSTLAALDNAPMPATTEVTNPDADGGTAEFGDITFTEAGTYHYTVTESGSVDGVTNDEYATKDVEIIVTDNGDGTLSAKVNNGRSVVFTNSYTAAPVSAKIPVTKKLSVPEGSDGPGDITGKYTFTLKAVTDGAPMPETTEVTNPDTNGGTAWFGDIEYTKPGTYKYTVTESGSVDGVTNDAQATKDVTVVVTDNGDGTLAATVNSGKDVTFTNTYSASPVTATISAKKVLAVKSGNNAPDITGKYTFTLKAVSKDAPMPETTKVTNPDADGGAIDFGEIEYTKAGTYRYTITESGSVKGIDNDTQVTRDVEVVVTDNHAGKLKVGSVTPQIRLTFTNTYKVASTKASIPVTKELSVPEGLTGPGDISGKYTFTLKAVSKDAPMPETTKVTNPDSTGGTAAFGDITFNEPGTYKYTVTESGSVGGVTNDAQATKDVTVVVTDNGDGTLTAQVNNGKDLTFTNTYTPDSATLDGDATLKATKVLTGAELTEGAFNFKAEVETENGTKTLTATNEKDGSVTFDASGLKYTKPGEYKATISEVIPDNAKGITYDTSTHDVTITVKDNGAGKLVASLDGNNPTFKNVYTAKGAANITFSKKVNGKDATTNMFHFTITADNGGALPENTTVENNGGSVNFGPIAYDESIFGEDDADDSSSTSSSAADESSSSSATDDGTAAKESTDTGDAAGSAAITSSTTESASTASESASSTESAASTSDENADGVEKAYAAEAKPAVQKDANGNRYIDYSYIITEANEGASGYTYDDAAMHVTIRVTDKGDGNLEAKVIYKDKTSFENTYSATGSATVTAKKVVEGTDLRDGQFTFGLYDGKDKVAEASNDASGNVTFTVDYDQTKIGTHVYTLKEISDGQTGYTYDGSAKTVVVEVADNGDGTLKCTTETGDELTFTNRYQPIATDITLHATKKYEDKSGKAKKLTAGEFKFQVADESGKVVGTASNKADGSVTFSSIPFTEAGTYTYTISEVKGSASRVTYDDSTYQVTVTVTDENGQLKAEATDDNPTFTNTYTPAATPTSNDDTPVKTIVKKVTEMPETGDYTPLLPIALALAGSGAVIAYGMKRRRMDAKVSGASHRR
ncbi:MAG: Spy0128 family protein [Eggerthellaceae bacterium]